MHRRAPVASVDGFATTPRLGRSSTRRRPLSTWTATAAAAVAAFVLVLVPGSVTHAVDSNAPHTPASPSSLTSDVSTTGVVVGVDVVGIDLSASVVASVSDDGASAPPDTVSDFYPEANDLSNCVGLVEKPGCGSSSRGGWGQYAVFGLLAVGLGIIIWRIAAGLRANQAARSDSTTDGDPGSPPRPAPDPDRDRSTQSTEERNQP